ncbi:N-acetyl sugar amidotransferase [Akkermansiaceae bacterium]|nr:N-acetyl sugar amidotransferase [Akkermansiaceae bacterium]
MIKICSRCIYDSTVPSISFDQSGVCNYCKNIDDLVISYGTGNALGISKIEGILNEIRKAGEGKKYDCIVGVSGGTDSSYMLHWAVENGLRPLAVHYDNTWNSAIATENIRKLLSKLNVDLYTHVCDNKEADDIFKSFFLAGVPEIDASTDLALAEVLYRAASKYGIKYVLEGHSFIAEGITPLGKNYFDGKYIKSIHRRYGKIRMKTYPLMTFWRFLKWIMFLRIRKIRPLWYLPYSKEEAKTLLKELYDWQDYGGHHLENRITSFAHGVYLPTKFNIDYRNNTLAAVVRNGEMDRDEAIDIYYNQSRYFEEDIVDYFKKRLSLSDQEYVSIMSSEPNYWYKFPTYKKRFERLRPLFKILASANLVPMSFYLKYCFPSKPNNLK